MDLSKKRLQTYEWLSMFHAESIVECDYGGLADYLEQALIANATRG
jgi:hypothetical protein